MGDDAIMARLGTVIAGRWRLRSVLGVGGMAAVYEAVDASGATAALKVLHPEMARRADVCKRFMREAVAGGQLSHPSAVKVFEHGVDGDSAYLAMELLNGETLASWTARHGPPATESILSLLHSVLGVLVVAHARGIIHRDIKPDNLFIALDGSVKVLDFGIARFSESMPGDLRTQTGTALGTMPYMPPEQALGRRDEIDGRADLFSLGATVFRVLSGRRIHEAPSEAELLMAMASKPAPPLRSVAPDIPQGLAQVLDLALAFSRDARYPDAHTMQCDVSALMAGSPPPFAQQRLASSTEPTRADAHAVPSGPLPLAATQPLESVGSSPGPGAGVAAAAAALVPAASTQPLPAPIGAVPLPGAGATGQASRGPRQASRPRKVARWLMTLAMLCLVLGGAVGAWWLSNDSDSLSLSPERGPSTSASVSAGSSVATPPARSRDPSPVRPPIEEVRPKPGSAPPTARAVPAEATSGPRSDSAPLAATGSTRAAPPAMPAAALPPSPATAAPLPSGSPTPEPPTSSLGDAGGLPSAPPPPAGERSSPAEVPAPEPTTTRRKGHGVEGRIPGLPRRRRGAHPGRDSATN